MHPGVSWRRPAGGRPGGPAGPLTGRATPPTSATPRWVWMPASISPMISWSRWTSPAWPIRWRPARLSWITSSWSLPPRFRSTLKVRGRVKKYILKRALDGLLARTRSSTGRRWDSGFLSTTGSVTNSRTWLYDTLLSARRHQSRVLSPDTVRRMLDEHVRGTDELGIICCGRCSCWSCGTGRTLTETGSCPDSAPC